MFGSCRSKIIEYKWLLLLLISYFGILVYCSPLDITQLDAGDKCFAHLYTAVTGNQIYPAPSYALISWIVARLPFSDGFSLSFFLSIIPAVGCVACVYFAIKKQTDIKGAPLFGSLILSSSFIFISQVVKVEVYAFIAFFLILGYTLMLYKKGALSAIAFGFALASHWVTAVPTIFVWFFYNREFRRKSYICFVIAILFLVIWKKMPVYDPNLHYDNFISSINVLILWWSSGSFLELLGNLSRIPIIIFILGFGWIPALLYFARNFKKSFPIIFIVTIPFLYLCVVMIDAGYQQMSVATPFLAVAAGLGFKYIQNINFKRIIISGSVILLLAVPFTFNIDTNPTSARNMINQLDNISDNSIVICYRQYENASDMLSMSVSWMVDYHNVTHNRHIYPFVVEYFQIPDKTKDLLDRNIIIPDISGMYNGSQIQVYKNIVNAFVSNNSGIDFYYYEIIDVGSMKCELRKWQ